MSDELEHLAEQRAEQAENMKIFSGIKLLHVKKQVENLLSHIGDYGIFSEYTKHDITHINEMLKIIEWIIPEKTRIVLTSAEWMMLVMSIYFHDMGMLVTKKEYENREKTEFVKYKKNVYDGVYGEEYLSKIIKLDDPDLFLYQEYVRKNHATRVKMWILGEKDDSINYTEDIMNEIKKLLAPLDDLFKKDLALICESHHLDDLDNISKYNTSKYYDSSEEGKVNLQYMAVILRTADLLHITMDRTPSIEYRVFCPSDPVSIIEWEKQMAVKSIMPKKMIDDNGNVDKNKQSNVITIVAYFHEANQAEAFFALMDYIRYVRKQLVNSFEVIKNSSKKNGTEDYIFPWNQIDDSQIETKNFSKRKLMFELDQASILQMLVGHTLYNDNSVVIRELVQNGLDAIKLQNELEKKNNQNITEGKIIVKWDSDGNTLSFIDNGTGMTVDDIENYLLKVGSSKYNSENFRKEFPDFVSISRFGIGILTCFLVADDIEIVTCSYENGEANGIFFRNVDGKYLLKNIMKSELDQNIKEHGTIIKLHLRDKNDAKNLELNLKRWIVFPHCDVYLQCEGCAEIKIGYESPKQVLEDYVGSIHSGKKIVVKEVEKDGIQLAYALSYKEHFHEYSLVEYNSRNYSNPSEEYYLPVGICFEGIRVSNNTPGYNRETFLAIMNTNNSKIVRTNVARSSVEENEGKNQLLKIIYTVYKKYIEKQIEGFIDRGKSLSWISTEIKFMIGQIVNVQIHGLGYAQIENRQLFEEVFSDLDSILYEKEGKRELVSPQYVKDLDKVNMFESNMLNAAEYLLKEAKGNISLGELVNKISDKEVFNSDGLLCDFEKNNLLHAMAMKSKEAKKIIINREDNMIDLFFENGKSLWVEVEVINSDSYGKYNVVYIPKEEVVIEGIKDELGVKTRMGVYLSYCNEITAYIRNNLDKFDYNNLTIDMLALRLFISLIINQQIVYIPKDRGYDYFEQIFQQRVEAEVINRVSDDIREALWEKIDRKELINVIMNPHNGIYDLHNWSRQFFNGQYNY